MAERDKADAKWSENQLAEEDSERTVNCLRGRLLAERTASRNATEQVEQLGNKLKELENLLRQEARSRNRAEKRLKLLMKRLASMNISYAADESQHSGLFDGTDISSATSSASSSNTKEPEKGSNLEMSVLALCGNRELEEKAKSPTGSASLQQIDKQPCSLSHIHCSFATTGGSPDLACEFSLPEFKGQECGMGSDEDPMPPIF